MKYFIGFFFALGLFLLIPTESISQSRSPVQDRRPTVRPPSQSRPPGGDRRPLRPSRRSQAMDESWWEIGGHLGTSLSLTDASGTSIDQRPSFLNSQWSQTSINVGAFGRYRINQFVASRISLNYGRISGDDAIADRSRGISFTNNIIEMAVVGEIYAPKSGPAFPLDFYGFFGIGGFYHNPQVTVENPDAINFTWDEYSNIQLAVPIGIGVNYMLNNGMLIGYEVGYRKLFTDYLDGFTREWSQGNDSYYFTSVKVTYPLSGTIGRVRF